MHGGLVTRLLADIQNAHLAVVQNYPVMCGINLRGVRCGTPPLFLTIVSRHGVAMQAQKSAPRPVPNPPFANPPRGRISPGISSEEAEESALTQKIEPAAYSYVRLE
jgi:hypothetical protein